ncbi:MAG: hypothetical protein V8T36_05360 [Ruthenibacterium lactatiformans]
MEKERFSTQEMANALAVSTPTAITLLRRLDCHGLAQPCVDSVPPADASPGSGAPVPVRGTSSGPTSLCA